MDRNGHPEVRLGDLQTGGLAPAVMAIIDRGVRRRPDLARSLDVEVELAFREQHPPVRIRFGSDGVLVEDGPASAPDLRIEGQLGDHIALMVAPVVGGLPSVFDPRGRAALGMVVSRRVRIQGNLGLVRRFLGVIHV
ncbi:MAG TPA: hypothetical protein VGF70_04310 [Solirubrobacteraceae bacterium]|jgi:hypothetical protein